AQAVEYFGRACHAGDSASCAEAGERWLRKETRDVSRAIPALETGCAGSSARACTRLARVYEEGDGTDVALALAAEMRDRTCTAGRRSRVPPFLGPKRDGEGRLHRCLAAAHPSPCAGRDRRGLGRGGHRPPALATGSGPGQGRGGRDTYRSRPLRLAALTNQA